MRSLHPKTTEEAEALLGSQCRAHTISYTTEPIIGKLVLWAPGPMQWLVHSEQLQQKGLGHPGHQPTNAVGKPTGDMTGHVWCSYECVELIQKMSIQGNTLILEDL